MSQSVPTQDELNRRVYNAPQVFKHYLSEVLVPAEIACLLRYQPHIYGRRVLDIGVGAGRTTRYLEPVSGRYVGIDYSPVMVACARRRLPGVNVRQADWRDLDAFEDESFDFILATDNVLDALSHEDRMRALRETARVLADEGLVAFSSHNLGYREAFGRPRMQWSRNPVTQLRNVIAYIERWANHFRVGRFRKVMGEYALLNDLGHNYACLHYYVGHRTVRMQLARVGLVLIEAIDCLGVPVGEGADDGHSPNLLYIARRESRVKG